MISKTGEAETITTHYLFFLGLYRALYLVNWIWRFYFEGFFDLIAVVAGVVQTILYCDFFYLYITKGMAALACTWQLWVCQGFRSLLGALLNHQSLCFSVALMLSVVYFIVKVLAARWVVCLSSMLRTLGLILSTTENRASPCTGRQGQEIMVISTLRQT